MADIVERLRYAATSRPGGICEEAANEIERLRAAPPAAPAVPLTDEQIQDIRSKLNHASVYCHGHGFDVALARAIEQAHGIGGGK